MKLREEINRDNDNECYVKILILIMIIIRLSQFEQNFPKRPLWLDSRINSLPMSIRLSSSVRDLCMCKIIILFSLV